MTGWDSKFSVRTDWTGVSILWRGETASLVQELIELESVYYDRVRQQV